MLGLIILLQTLTLVVSGPATSPEYLPIWVAAADGHFDRQGLKVTVRPTRSEVGAAEALAQGQADLVATSIEALLRFGARDGQSPRLLLGLTAAPPVALVVDTAQGPRVRSVPDLAGLRVGISAPGAPEHAWLNVLLARANLSPTKVHVVSAGSHVIRALASGELHAALVPDAAANQLVGERRATLLADLRTPAAAERALGFPTVSAAVFVRGERRPGERELAAFTRAILSAEERLAAGRVSELVTRLPRNVVGSDTADFEARVQQARGLYLPDGHVSDERLEMTVTFLRDSLPLPGRARIQLLPPGRVKPTRGS